MRPISCCSLMWCLQESTCWILNGRRITLQSGIDYLPLEAKPLFSSPEHKVLTVSYCDWSLSVMRRRASPVVRPPSSVVRKLFYLNIFSSETAHWILTKLHGNDSWVVPYQSYSNCSSWLHK